MGKAQLQITSTQMVSASGVFVGLNDAQAALGYAPAVFRTPPDLGIASPAKEGL